MQETDSAAIERVVAGDGDAFEVLVERYSRGLFRLAWRMTGSESDADDVVQETFLRAYRGLAEYDGRASFSTWLYRIATNYTLDLLARRRRRGEQQPPETADDGPQWEAAAGDAGPERLAESGELGRRLGFAMKQLSEQERAAFTLRHWEDLSIDEISETLGLGPSATKHSIFRAVQKLRRLLAPFVRAEA